MYSGIIRFGLPVVLAATVAGCVQGSSAPSVTLAQVQAEGNAIVAALEAGATLYTSANTTTPAEATAVENVLTIAKTENAALQSNLAIEGAAQAVETMGQDITAVLAVLPIDPVTKVAIDAGIAVLDTFIAEQMVLPATPPASAELGLNAAPARVAPPVPIPTPHRLPPIA